MTRCAGFHEIPKFVIGKSAVQIEMNLEISVVQPSAIDISPCSGGMTFILPNSFFNALTIK